MIIGGSFDFLVVRVYLRFGEEFICLIRLVYCVRLVCDVKGIGNRELWLESCFYLVVLVG